MFSVTGQIFVRVTNESFNYLKYICAEYLDLTYHLGNLLIGYAYCIIIFATNRELRLSSIYISTLHA